ncbi:MAG TPA: endonuclease/exonuclease/phosphatase family protein [Vicinamibacterales bacterium]|nr:endonuclease/exonuclease/phosphatase family protein [Vicinamibacterales bacterium]
MKSRVLKASLAAALLPLALIASPAAAPEPDLPVPLPCFATVEGVTWIPWTASGRETLDRWCASVGPPVLVASTARPSDVRRLMVVTWNVHVGGGQVEDFVKTHWTDREHSGLVLLLQETYRGDENVPDSFPKGLKVPAAIRPNPRSLDVLRLAERLKMSVTYVPSMRNGRATETGQREDRGNAILSTEPLTDVRAIALPFGKQRRVAVAATVTPGSSTIGPLRVVATHFDIGSDRVAQASAFADRIAQLSDLPMIVGGDFNSPSGLRDKAVQAVSRTIPMESCGTSRTFTWPQRFNLLAILDFGRFDFLFSNLESSGMARECRTIDDLFRSDHRPVMLTMQH